jgi:hypothetical protein
MLILFPTPGPPPDQLEYCERREGKRRIEDSPGVDQVDMGAVSLELLLQEIGIFGGMKSQEGGAEAS